MKQEFTYDIFISYRQTNIDKETAKLLQKMLEMYKIPHKYQNGRKRFRVFRDGDEISASSDLKTELEGKLKDSRFLVVICSPDTPESKWVREEIKIFSKYRGHEYIFPVLSSGDKPVFPLELLIKEDHQGEPLAVDFRNRRDRKKCKKEFLRLLAGMFPNCSFEELWQRQRKRQLKRVSFASFIIIAFILAWGINNQRQIQKINENYKISQLNESKYLAELSEKVLDEGDRYEAIRLALKALPESSESNDRPLLLEAVRSLNDALNFCTLPAEKFIDYSIVKKLEYSSRISFVEASPDKKKVMAVTTDNKIYFWDENGNLINIIDIIIDNSYKISFFANDKVLVYSDYGLKCYEIISGLTVWEKNNIKGLYNNLDIVLIEEKKRYIKKIILCDINTGKNIVEKATDYFSTFTVTSILGISSDQRNIIYEDIEGIKIFNLETQKVSETFDTLFLKEYYLEGNYLYVVTFDVFNARAIKYNFAENKVCWEKEIKKGTDTVPKILDKDNNFIFCIGNALYFLNDENGEINRIVYGSDYIANVRNYQDGGNIICEDGKVFSYTDNIDIMWANLLPLDKVFFMENSNMFTVSLDNNRILIYSGNNDLSYIKKFDDLHFMAVSDDGQYFCAYEKRFNTFEECRKLNIYNNNGDKLESKLYIRSNSDVLFAYNNNIIYTEDNYIIKYNIYSEIKQTVKLEQNYKKIYLSGDKKKLGVWISDNLFVYNLINMELLDTLYLPEQICDIYFNSNGNNILLYGANNKKYFYKWNGSKYCLYNNKQVHNEELSVIKKADIVALVTQQNQIELVNINSKESLKVFDVNGTQNFKQLSSPSGQYIFWATDDKYLQCYDLINKKFIPVDTEEIDFINEWYFSTDETLLSVKNRGCLLTIFYKEKEKWIRVCQIKYGIALLPDGKTILVNDPRSYKGELAIYKSKTYDELIDAAKEILEK